MSNIWRNGSGIVTNILHTSSSHDRTTQTRMKDDTYNNKLLKIYILLVLLVYNGG